MKKAFLIPLLSIAASACTSHKIEKEGNQFVQTERNTIFPLCNYEQTVSIWDSTLKSKVDYVDCDSWDGPDARYADTIPEAEMNQAELNSKAVIEQMIANGHDEAQFDQSTVVCDGKVVNATSVTFANSWKKAAEEILFIPDLKKSAQTSLKNEIK